VQVILLVKPQVVQLQIFVLNVLVVKLILPIVYLIQPALLQVLVLEMYVPNVKLDTIYQGLDQVAQYAKP